MPLRTRLNTDNAAVDVRGHASRFDDEGGTRKMTGKVLTRLEKLRSELAQIILELKSTEVEGEALKGFREAIDAVGAPAWALQPAWPRPSKARPTISARVMQERLRRTCELNINICRDFEAGVIQMDQGGFSVYLLVLVYVMSEFDVIFGSRELAR